MDRNDIDWQGFIPAITTAFDKQNEFSPAMQGELLEWMLQEGMHGIIVAGTTGEWFSMSFEEKSRLYKVTGEVLSGKISILAGCNAFTAKESVALAQVAGQHGFDGILVTPPPYIKPCAREVYTFYADISAGSPLPICVYNWPPGTGLDLELELLERICDLDKVVALKNSTGSPEKFLRDATALKDKVRIYGAPMNEQGIKLIEDGLSQGLMGSGAVLGRNQPAFFDELWAGNHEKALDYGAMDRRVMLDWFDIHYMAKFGSAQAIMKTALNLQGLPGGLPRRPVLPLEDKEVAVIRKTLTDLGIL
ncbi:dihydrodipicolinate synthase family protein [Emcibacter nanhaiensis]|uniref:Dihydrodipicolinate synthase family protein n=1 Tax=Emcibacter nanhaiensis TaxID=1505037 RepID=A0A501PIB7_9PROT|nr:dihydrodipicolinate synthase family protein [Emcibacter nanhaiensis]TPD60233.1 dihydrodipicolinate synthase family protein [Emcibacter nanhaiensis]